LAAPFYFREAGIKPGGFRSFSVNFSDEKCLVVTARPSRGKRAYANFGVLEWRRHHPRDATKRAKRQRLKPGSNLRSPPLSLDNTPGLCQQHLGERSEIPVQPVHQRFGFGIRRSAKPLSIRPMRDGPGGTPTGPSLLQHIHCHRQQ
jgi:hypothetical protein